MRKQVVERWGASGPSITNKDLGSRACGVHKQQRPVKVMWSGDTDGDFDYKTLLSPTTRKALAEVLVEGTK